MISDHIATAQGVHPNLAGISWADVSDSTVGDVILVGGVGFLIQNIQQASRGAGWRVDLVTVVHFRDLDIEGVLLEDASREAREVEKGVYADRKVWRVNDWDFL